MDWLQKLAAISICLLVAVFVAPMGAVRSAAADSDAISTLAGGWRGSGRIHYTDGTSEGISCTAYYRGGGRTLGLAIQCRSEKNPIHIRSKLQISGGKVSGNWEERTFNASGTTSGTVGRGSLHLNIAGGGFSGTMSVSFGRSVHTVTVSTQGIAMKSASMNFKRQ